MFSSCHSCRPTLNPQCATRPSIPLRFRQTRRGEDCYAGPENGHFCDLGNYHFQADFLGGLLRTRHVLIFYAISGLRHREGFIYMRVFKVWICRDGHLGDFPKIRLKEHANEVQSEIEYLTPQVFGLYKPFDTWITLSRFAFSSPEHFDFFGKIGMFGTSRATAFRQARTLRL